MKKTSRTSRIILIFCISAFAFSVNAQELVSSEPGIPVQIESIKPFQAGTVELLNGKAAVQLNDRVTRRLSANKEITYFVVLTPIGSCGQVGLSEKGNNNFVIREITTANDASGSSAHSCDYIVFIKEDISPLSGIMK